MAYSDAGRSGSISAWLNYAEANRLAALFTRSSFDRAR
jgi:hypothetical protein